MTVHIPRWVLIAVAACLIAVVAFLIGKGSGSNEPDLEDSEPAAEVQEETDQAKIPALGDRAFSEPYGHGFGTVQPKSIYNGGDSSGLVENIRWEGWGESSTYGTGLGHQFRPNGGYYEKPVEVRLQARKLGNCGDAETPAYTLLLAQFQERPGGPFGSWMRWSGAGSICHPGF